MLLLPLLLAVGALAQFEPLPFDLRVGLNNTNPPTVDVANVTVTGTTFYGLDGFFGVPYAEPPVGDLRFAHPQMKAYSEDFTAQLPSKACLQDMSTYNTQFGMIGISEDCLYLNVLGPKGVAGTNASLPVMVWIHGGSFIGAQGSRFLSPWLVQRGIDTDRPFILVTLNYRLGLLGFGYGEEIASNGAANLGIRDQRLALQWVQKYIANFGGDPTRVMLFGESAGGISVAIHMLEVNQTLFRSAIVSSGAVNTAPIAPTAEGFNRPYEEIANMTGCLDNDQYNSTFDCLKHIDAMAINNASNTLKATPPNDLPFYFAPSIDSELIKDRATRLFRAGQFSRIPFIMGNTKDEGSIFCGWPPYSYNTTQDITSFLDILLPDKPLPDSVVEQVIEHYPDIPALGCPYDTGNETFGYTPRWKQCASIASDALFQSRRRDMLNAIHSQGWDKMWSYLWDEKVPGVPDWLGVVHAADNRYVFGAPTVMVPEQTEQQADLSRMTMDFWINFAYYNDPNGLVSAEVNNHDRGHGRDKGGKGGKGRKGGKGHKDGDHDKGDEGAKGESNALGDEDDDTAIFSPNDPTPGLPYWYRYNPNGLRASMHFNANRSEVIRDVYRDDQMSVWYDQSVSDAFGFRKREA